MSRPTQKSLLSFNSGIWGALMDGRIDMEKYKYSCRQAENYLITPQGALARRPGSYYIQNTKSDGAAVLWPFQFSTDVGYIIEIGNLYMRFYRNGAYIAASEIVSPYTEADLRSIQFRQINDVVYITHEDYATRKLIRKTETEFTLEETPFDLPPMRNRNLSRITITPSATTGNGITLTATAPVWVTGTVYNVGDYRLESGLIYKCLIRHAAGTFATDLAAGKWEEYEVFTAGNVGGYFRLGHRRSATSVKKQLKDKSVDTSDQSGDSDWLSVLGDWNIRTTGRVGGLLQIIRENPTTLVEEIVREYDIDNGNRSIDQVGPQNEEARMKLRFTHRLRDGSATEYQPDDDGSEDPYAYLEAADAYVYGWAKIATYVSAVSVTADVFDQFHETTATDFWEEGAWSDRRGYPRTCTLFEQRMFYAGNTAEPLKVWASAIGDFENFTYGVDDSDAFSYSIPSTEQNPIEWIAGHKTIVVGNGKEYGLLSSGSDDLPLSPTNAIYRVQESIGFSSIKPEIIGDIMVGVERNGRRIREIAYNINSGVSGGYTAADLNSLNSDISESGIIDLDYAQLREPYIYAVMSDGSMGVLHYNRTDGIIGWSKFTTQGSYESIAVIRGSDNDEVWTVVKRTINGAEVRFIERFNPTTWSSKEDAYFVDAGATYDGVATTTITGLAHLNGAECQILSDGAVEPDDLPSAGQLTLVQEGSVVHVGLGFGSVFEPMRLDIDNILGNSQGHQKIIRKLYVRLYKTLGMSFSNGITEDILPFRDTDDNMDESPPLFTGELEVSWDGTFGEDPTLNDPKVVLKQTQPLPSTIIVVVVKYSIGNK